MRRHPLFPESQGHLVFFNSPALTRFFELSAYTLALATARSNESPSNKHTFARYQLLLSSKMARLTIATLVAALAALAQAVQLTNSDFNLVPGQPFTIEWAEASGPVTLRLKTGPSDALVTVQEITSTAIFPTSFVMIVD